MSSCLQAIQQGATELRLHVSSDGGSNLDGFAMHNFLRSLPIPVTTHNIGNIESMAVLVFLAGDRRLVSPEARFLLHALYWGFNAGGVDHGRLKEYVATLDHDAERYAAIFEERTKGGRKPIAIRDHLLGPERFVFPSESVDTGLCHAVEVARLPKGAVAWWLTG